MSSLVSESVLAMALAAILCSAPLYSSNAKRIRATVRARRRENGSDPRLRG